MGKRLLTILSAVMFNLISIALISSVVLYRADVIAAQSGSSKLGDVALVPRSVEIVETEDDDDDSGDADPPTDNDGYDTPPGEEYLVVTYTIRPGDTLMKIALRLGIPYAVLKAQDDTPSLIHPGQKFIYRPSDRVDSSVPLTDDDGTDSDGYDTPPPSTDFDGISTPVPTSYDGTDSDGYDTTGYYTDNDGVDTPLPGGISARQLQQAQLQQSNQRQNDPYTDNDGYDTTPFTTDNDGTDSDGIDTPASGPITMAPTATVLTPPATGLTMMARIATGVATTPVTTNNPSPATPDSPDSPDSDDSGVSS